MKKTKIIFWIITGLFSALMLLTSWPDIMVSEDAVKFMKDQLGYPMYMIPFVGWAKVLGIIAILIPGFPRIKEWAYAGLFFDLAGATYSIIAFGGLDSGMIFMLVFFALLFGSYFYYHKLQKESVQ